VAAENTTGGDSGGTVTASNTSDTVNSSSSEDSQQLINTIIGVKVNYEYSDDVINPEIRVKDSNGVNINFTKTYNIVFRGHEVSFNNIGAVNGTKFNVSVSAPGYITQEQQISVFLNALNATDANLYGSATFNMIATANYRLGREVTRKADELLNFSTADAVLCITTAGVPRRNGTTTEDSIEGILNQANGLITKGRGNLLILRKTAVDTVNFAFIAKRGAELTLVYFHNGSLIPAYHGTISVNMTQAQWTNANHKIGKDTYPIASLANAWAVGTPTDLLRAAAFHGHMCDGIISGYAISEVLLKYFPPIQETLTHAGAPYDKTSYRVVTIPGDSKDDAFVYILNLTPGKGGSLSGYDTSATGATRQMAAFIRWNGELRTGTLIVLNFNRTAFQKDFKNETGLIPTPVQQHDHSHDGVTLDHVHSDMYPLKLTTWLLGKLNENPEKYVNILLAKEGLTEEQFHHILGADANITNPDGTVRIPAREAAGLDMIYITGLNLPNAVPAVPSPADKGQLTPEQMKQIGIDAANLARQIFLNEKGINLEKDDRDLLVLTSAGYSRLNGQLTDMTMDGIFEVLGSRLSRYTLLPMHNTHWKPLYFSFTLRGADGVTMHSVYMSYDPENHKFVVGTGADGKQVNDIGPIALNNQTQLNNLRNNIFKEDNFGNIQSIANVWRNNPPFHQLLAFLFHDHACPGVQPGFFIVDRILTEFPLSGQENYFWLSSRIYCKDDSLTYLLGISPGSGTYMSQRLPRALISPEIPEEGVLVVWDPVTRTGRAVIVSFRWPQFNLTGLNTREAQREAQIAGFIALYRGLEFDRIIRPIELHVTDPKYITEAEFNTIKAGGTADFNAHEFLRSLPFRRLSDLIQVPGGDHIHGGTDGHTHGPGGHVHGQGMIGQTPAGADAPATPGIAPGRTQPTGAAAPATPGETGEEGQRAYEVARAAPGASGATDRTIIYGVIGLVSVLALLGAGFFRETILSLLGFAKK